MSDRFEYQRKVPSPLVPGEYWTRDGRRAVIEAQASECIFYPVKGKIYGTIANKASGRIEEAVWTEDGYHSHPWPSHGNDLMFVYKR